jgi:branched-chain amino acid transport system ATP-binding protein
VDIALVLAQQPELIVLVEPAAGLSAAETRDLIAMLKATIGPARCFWTSTKWISSLRYRNGSVLDYGHVLTEGTPDEISADPQAWRVVQPLQKLTAVHLPPSRHGRHRGQ